MQKFVFSTVLAVCFTLLGESAWAFPSRRQDGLNTEGVFSGRLSKLNKKAGLLRVAIDFENSKYLADRDQVEFWNEQNPSQRCEGYVAGRSPEYLLLKVPEFKFCDRHIAFNPGSYMVFYSQDLINNLEMGRHLMEILVKKRLALKGKLKKREKELETHVEKVNAVNKRYQVLRDKLEAEWENKINDLEEDRSASLRAYEDLRIRLNELKYKIEQYRIKDKNLETDRWSLDPELYYKE